jgi:hypothetical protein
VRSSHQQVARVFTAVLVGLMAACAWGLGLASAGHIPIPDFPIGSKGAYLSECASFGEKKKRACYIAGMLRQVEKSGDPSTELPKIDKTVRTSGGYVASNCHILMHEVGRRFARENDVTLETLFKYTPKSNDPGCSAGFGMGMVMHLGTELVIEPEKVVGVCEELPTRFREYTCYHGSGHAFMRGYHGILASAIVACKTLGSHTPDCAQGAFHDYWISLSGGDGTKKPKNADARPRSVCAKYAYPRPCWYRFFWERKQSASVSDQGDVVRLCKGTSRGQRSGCIGGASLLLQRAAEPVDHAEICGRMTRKDSVDCLRGVNVPALEGDRYAQLRLVRTCKSHPRSNQRACYSWFGRTLNVVTNGSFERSGCPRLKLEGARQACVAGARKLGQPLGTFA